MCEHGTRREERVKFVLLGASFPFLPSRGPYNKKKGGLEGIFRTTQEREGSKERRYITNKNIDFRPFLAFGKEGGKKERRVERSGRMPPSFHPSFPSILRDK
jgi:hypothetical protein